MAGSVVTLLIAVVPFVAKVLDACQHSRVFMPPNPWVMGVMSLLVELYQVPDLKLNLKFEIEVLAKTLKVELNEIVPSHRLATRVQDRSQTEGDQFWVGQAFAIPNRQGKSCVHKVIEERGEWIAGSEFGRGDYAVAVKWWAKTATDTEERTYG